MTEVIRVLRKKLGSGNIRSLGLGLTLAETLVKNCGAPVHREVASERFMAAVAKIARVSSLRNCLRCHVAVESTVGGILFLLTIIQQVKRCGRSVVTNGVTGIVSSSVYSSCAVSFHRGCNFAGELLVVYVFLDCCSHYFRATFLERVAVAVVDFFFCSTGALPIFLEASLYGDKHPGLFHAPHGHNAVYRMFHSD